MKMTWLGWCVGAGGRWMCRILDEADMSYGCRRETESQHTVVVQTQKKHHGAFWIIKHLQTFAVLWENNFTNIRIHSFITSKMMLSNTAVNLKIDQIEFGFVDCIKLIKHLKNQPNASFFFLLFLLNMNLLCHMASNCWNRNILLFLVSIISFRWSQQNLMSFDFTIQGFEQVFCMQSGVV